MNLMCAFNELYPFDEFYTSSYTEEEYQEWITTNLEQYYKEITDGTIEKTRE